MKTKRSILLIDGSNFYFKLKKLKLHHLLEFDFSSFSSFLARKTTIVKRNYYVGKIRQDGTEKTEKLFAAQQKLIAKLKQHQFHYSLGFLLKNDGVYHEKGVDVQIAVDILVSTYENVCDHIILVSSDTDLSPAIKKAVEKGKTIEYVGFSHQPSLGLIKFCSESTLLKEEDLKQFLSPHK
ncbi:hypothetical protein A3H89_03520 [Candidatus Amesbacteria bacterium RIFCSPLOWO2_02_FULL_48_11]|nr:MAG: hypothetical protein A2V48_00760 [Candidatus Amesbacteria bacterium RBG_19FT_COMBO_48_16]OGC96638.1 MAG: hypothetical protein A3C34_00850 [Candidatus Amesbacteria bacterium RIFCSPHIGHO2_02_FULL_48_21]OGC99372.1 MAG: hypothetical protein A2W16_01995 [Candidatus Amesbacteria bacterium RBG_16_48_31]OGD00237.1 MAG: hypothetical protein A2702_01910 [Candidatus Amesbacteria bacterium RIFCSPHIGHO2_01_FULL_48_75]OGD01234.1 MAG: hypothetical protein A2354_01335 [Candidatus Amesbacteria bacterium